MYYTYHGSGTAFRSVMTIVALSPWPLLLLYPAGHQQEGPDISLVLLRFFLATLAFLVTRLVFVKHLETIS